MPRVSGPDDTENRLTFEVIGNKVDAAVTSVGTTASIIAYIKGILNQMATNVALVLAGDTLGEANGETDVDISEADYTDFVTILTIVPAAGGLRDLHIYLDYNKDTTGLDTIATAADVIDSAVVTKIDGTNLRHVMNGAQVTANGDGSLDSSESGQHFYVGSVSVAQELQVQIRVDTERDDAEIPYRVTYHGAAPTITEVAAA